jgi:hypothetical protein
MLLETFPLSRGHVNMSLGPVNMSWEHVNKSWELVNMSWEPVHMSGTLLQCHASLRSYILSHCVCPDRLLAWSRAPFPHLCNINNVWGSLLTCLGIQLTCLRSMLTCYMSKYTFSMSKEHSHCLGDLLRGLKEMLSCLGSQLTCLQILLTQLMIATQSFECVHWLCIPKCIDVHPTSRLYHFSFNSYEYLTTIWRPFWFIRQNIAFVLYVSTL